MTKHTLFARRAVSVPVNKQVFNGMGTGICNRTCGKGGVKVAKCKKINKKGWGGLLQGLRRDKKGVKGVYSRACGEMKRVGRGFTIGCG
jgi:hypothetical protein